MSVLVIGHPHCGKTQLIHSFMTGKAPTGKEKGSTVEGSSSSSSSSNSNSPYLSSYSPTIEDGHTFQYVLPPNPNYTAHYNPPPPPPPSANVPREPIMLVNGEMGTEITKTNVADQEERARQNRQRIVLQLLDAGGNPAYSKIWKSMVQAADAYMLVYDVGNRQSFERIFPLFRLIVETRCVLPKEIPVIIVGNMVDTVGERRQREVSADLGLKLASILGVPFKETTAKAVKSVEHCFRTVIEETQTRVFRMMSDALDPIVGRLGEDHGNGLGGTVKSRWASSQSIGSGFMKKWQNRRPSDSSMASVASIMTGSSLSVSSSGGQASPNIVSTPNSTASSSPIPHPAALASGFRFSAGSRRSLGSVEKPTEPTGRDSVQSGDTGELSDGASNSAAPATGAVGLFGVKRSSSAISLSSSTSGQQPSESVKPRTVPSNNLKPVGLDSTRYKRDVAFSAWKALQASRRNSISSLSSGSLSSRRGRSVSTGQSHQNRSANEEPPPVPPRRGKSYSELNRLSLTLSATSSFDLSLRSSEDSNVSRLQISEAIPSIPHTTTTSASTSSHFESTTPKAPQNPSLTVTTTFVDTTSKKSSTASTKTEGGKKKKVPRRTDSLQHHAASLFSEASSLSSASASPLPSASHTPRPISINPPRPPSPLRDSFTLAPTSPEPSVSFFTASTSTPDRPISTISSHNVSDQPPQLQPLEFMSPPLSSLSPHLSPKTEASRRKRHSDDSSLLQTLDMLRNRNSRSSLRLSVEGSPKTAASDAAIRHLSIVEPDSKVETKRQSTASNVSSLSSMSDRQDEAPSAEVVGDEEIPGTAHPSRRHGVDLSQAGWTGLNLFGKTIQFGTSSSNNSIISTTGSDPSETPARGRAGSSPPALKARSRSASSNRSRNRPAWRDRSIDKVLGDRPESPFKEVTTADSPSWMGGSSRAGTKPALDQVQRNLQVMMEALEAYQIGEDLSAEDGSGSLPRPSAESRLNRSKSADALQSAGSGEDGYGRARGGKESASALAGGSGATGGRFLSRAGSSMGRVGLLGRLRSTGTAVSGAGSPASSPGSPGGPNIAVSPPSNSSTPEFPSSPRDSTPGLHPNLRLPRPSASNFGLTSSQSAPLPLSSYLADPLPSNLVMTRTNSGPWRQSLLLGEDIQGLKRPEVDDGAWFREPWDDDLELLQEMDELELGDIDGDLDELPFEEDDDEIVRSVVGGMVGALVESGDDAENRVAESEAAVEKDSERIEEQDQEKKDENAGPSVKVTIPRDELKDPRLAKRGSNYFPAPGIYIPNTPIRSRSSNQDGAPSPLRSSASHTPNRLGRISEVFGTPPSSADDAGFQTAPPNLPHLPHLTRVSETAPGSPSSATTTSVSPSRSLLMAHYAPTTASQDDEPSPTPYRRHERFTPSSETLVDPAFVNDAEKIRAIATGAVGEDGNGERGRVERLKDVVEGLEEEEIEEVVKEYVARSAAAAAEASLGVSASSGVGEVEEETE
ncbi:hypothetical protein HDU97_008119 [Phlyctochytrium planicorne]|nr:hypothetical protein HDU97_008119 [Phlyctochytrium planicorne]